MISQQLNSTAQHQENIIVPITNPEKDQNWQFRLWFLLNVYYFYTIANLKNLNSSTIKLGTVSQIYNHHLKLALNFQKLR